MLFWSFSIRTSIFLGNILLVLLDWNCQNEYHHDQVTLHWAQRDAINFWFSSTCSIISFERILYLFSGVVKFTHQSFFFLQRVLLPKLNRKNISPVVLEGVVLANFHSHKIQHVLYWSITCMQIPSLHATLCHWSHIL